MKQHGKGGSEEVLQMVEDCSETITIRYKRVLKISFSFKLFCV